MLDPCSSGKFVANPSGPYQPHYQSERPFYQTELEMLNCISSVGLDNSIIFNKFDRLEKRKKPSR
jgi:hypothetical protein